MIAIVTCTLEKLYQFYLHLVNPVLIYMIYRNYNQCYFHNSAFRHIGACEVLVTSHCKDSGTDA